VLKIGSSLDLQQSTHASLYRLFGPVIYSRCRRALVEEGAAVTATREVFERVQHVLDAADPRSGVEAIARACESVCARPAMRE
jgi:RNA polymerase sigma-70 factor, ECF subfamily